VISHRKFIYLFSMAMLLFIQGCEFEGKLTVGESTSLSRTSMLPANDPDCPNGGILLESGIDDNNNGVLDTNEVDSSQKTCAGNVSDSSGDDELTMQTEEPAGANCPYGGVRFDVGIDNNANGVLDTDEITSTEYVCQTNESLSSNARLDNISLSSGSLDQLFQPSQTTYTATVGYLINSLSVTAWTEDEQAGLQVNGVSTLSGAASSAIALNEGANTITLKVTAEDGVTTLVHLVIINVTYEFSRALRAYNARCCRNDFV
jgi:hypothetical protein